MNKNQKHHEKLTMQINVKNTVGWFTFCQFRLFSLFGSFDLIKS